MKIWAIRTKFIEAKEEPGGSLALLIKDRVRDKTTRAIMIGTKTQIRTKDDAWKRPERISDWSALSHEQRVVFCFCRDQNLWYPYAHMPCLLFAFVSPLLAWDFIQSNRQRPQYIHTISPLLSHLSQNQNRFSFPFVFALNFDWVLRRLCNYCSELPFAWLMGNPTSLLFTCIHVHYKKVLPKPGFPVPSSPGSLSLSLFHYTVVRKVKKTQLLIIIN